MDQDARSQLELNDEINQFNAPRNAELGNLQDFQGLLGFGDATAFRPETTAGSGSTAQGILGGAASGAAIGTQFGSPLVGAGVGAAIGAFV